MAEILFIDTTNIPLLSLSFPPPFPLSLSPPPTPLYQSQFIQSLSNFDTTFPLVKKNWKNWKNLFPEKIDG